MATPEIPERKILPSDIYMREALEYQSSLEYQRLIWNATEKCIRGLINKINISNFDEIVWELFQLNLLRAKGLVSHLVIEAQDASPMFTHIYAALVAIISSKLPQVGELIIKRLIVRFKKSFRRNDQSACIATVKFMAHLVNQRVLHNVVAVDLLTFLLLVNDTTDESVELAVGFIKDCGLMLKQLNSEVFHVVFESFHCIMHFGNFTSHAQCMIEDLFTIEKDNFKDQPSVQKELDLVCEENLKTYQLSLMDDFDTQDRLNLFEYDPNYLKNEAAYEAMILEVSGASV